jgi:hypothetical protein
MLGIEMVGLGATAGAAAGGVAGWIVSRRRAQADDESVMPDLEIRPDKEDEIDEMAQRWATSQGIPEASDLVSRKLRLASRLGSRRQKERRCRY